MGIIGTVNGKSEAGSTVDSPGGGTAKLPRFAGANPVIVTPLMFVWIGRGMFVKSMLLPLNFGS